VGAVVLAVHAEVGAVHPGEVSHQEAAVPDSLVVVGVEVALATEAGGLLGAAVVGSAAVDFRAGDGAQEVVAEDSGDHSHSLWRICTIACITHLCQRSHVVHISRAKSRANTTQARQKDCIIEAKCERVIL